MIIGTFRGEAGVLTFGQNFSSDTHLNGTGRSVVILLRKSLLASGGPRWCSAKCFYNPAGRVVFVTRDSRAHQFNVWKDATSCSN